MEVEAQSSDGSSIKRKSEVDGMWYLLSGLPSRAVAYTSGLRSSGAPLGAAADAKLRTLSPLFVLVLPLLPLTWLQRQTNERELCRRSIH